MSGRRADWPRFARAEIRSFAEWLDREGWTYEGTDSDGHTIWRHPQAFAQFKLPSTPKHFNVRITRAEVLRLLGRRPEGKRKGKAKVKPPRQDFAIRQVRQQTAQRRASARTLPDLPAPWNRSPIFDPGSDAVSARRTPKRLPWEDQPDDYDRGIDRLMRERPHR